MIEPEDDTASIVDGGDHDQEDDAASTPVAKDPLGQDLGGKPQTGLV